MAIILRKFTTFRNIPELNRAFAGPNSNLRTRLVPMYTRNGVGIQIAEFDNSIVICVPKVKAAIEGH